MKQITKIDNCSCVEMKEGVKLRTFESIFDYSNIRKIKYSKVLKSIAKNGHFIINIKESHFLTTHHEM